MSVDETPSAIRDLGIRLIPDTGEASYGDGYWKPVYRFVDGRSCAGVQSSEGTMLVTLSPDDESMVDLLCRFELDRIQYVKDLQTAELALDNGPVKRIDLDILVSSGKAFILCKKFTNLETLLSSSRIHFAFSEKRGYGPSSGRRAFRSLDGFRAAWRALVLLGHPGRHLL